MSDDEDRRRGGDDAEKEERHEAQDADEKKDADGDAKEGDKGDAGDAPAANLSEEAEKVLRRLQDDGKVQKPFDDEALEDLAKIPAEGQVATLGKFEQAVDEGQSIHNASGFLRGIVRRYQESEKMNDKFKDLPEAAKEMLEKVFARGGLTRDALQERSLALLLNMDEDTMKRCIEKYLDTPEEDIKRPEPFMHGIVRRASSSGNRRGGRSGGGGGGRGEALDPAVQDAINELVRDNIVRDGEIDQRSMDDLAALGRDASLEIIENLRRSDVSKIRNMGAFFNGIIRRFKGDRGGGRDRGGGGGRDYGRGGRDRDYGGRGGDYRDRYDDRGYRDDRGYDRGGRGYDRGGYDRGGYDRYDDRDGGYDDRRGYDRGGSSFSAY